MSRSSVLGAALLVAEICLLATSAARAQAPPVVMPETPPELPGGGGNSGPADRAPSLAPQGISPSSAIAPHGGGLIALEFGLAEFVYDETRHAITIYLPRSMGPADFAHSHGPAIPGTAAPHAVPSAEAHFGHGFDPHACPLGDSHLECEFERGLRGYVPPWRP